MSTFVVLPPRELLEHSLQEFLERILPGVRMSEDWTVDFLNRLRHSQPETYLIHREELPEVQDTAGVIEVLTAAFGAATGDRVLEIGPPKSLSPSTVRETIVRGSVSALLPAR